MRRAQASQSVSPRVVAGAPRRQPERNVRASRNSVADFQDWLGAAVIGAGPCTVGIDSDALAMCALILHAILCAYLTSYMIIVFKSFQAKDLPALDEDASNVFSKSERILLDHATNRFMNTSWVFFGLEL